MSSFAQVQTGNGATTTLAAVGYRTPPREVAMFLLQVGLA